jgi:hypothetical protein
MIQRSQTIWFFLAAVSGFAMTQLPLYIATFANNVIRRFVATESLLLFSLVILLACLAAVCIFLFKNRSLQFKLAVIGVLASIGVIGLQVWQIENFRTSNSLVRGSYYWGSLFPVAMTIFFILAAKGVYRDEKLIKSIDRLR